MKKEKFDWHEFFSANLGKVMANQMACAEHVVKDRNWGLDLQRGVISFGEDEFTAQFLGGESNSAETWLWGWENINNFPDKILTFARKIKAIGEELDAEPLTTAEIELDDDFNGHTLSIVSVAVSKEKVCYYRGPHDGGAIFVVFSDVPEEVFAPVDAPAFAQITMQSIQSFDVDHKIFIEGFLKQNGTKYEWQGDSVIAKFESGGDLAIDFEKADDGKIFRIAGIKNV
ncbi:MAG: hypothetical protein LBU83_01075 [Bacteroidales bacterium]|jgi:hypothetical protein|nr:hypothetical protein [Bacteroidales bacterium]